MRTQDEQIRDACGLYLFEGKWIGTEIAWAMYHKQTGEKSLKEHYALMTSSGGKARWAGRTKEERSAHGKMMAEKKKLKDNK